MTNKTNLIAKIRDNLTLNPNIITDTDHENFLHTDADSVVQALYADEITDNQVSQSVTSTSLSNLIYNVRFRKVGSIVTLSGSLFSTTFIQSGAIIFDITDPNLQTYNLFYTNAFKQGSSETVLLSIDGNNVLRANNNVLASETFRFTLTYNTSI